MYDLQILHQCDKRVKTKSQKVLGLISAFVEVTREKLVGGSIFPLPSQIGLKEVTLKYPYCGKRNFQHSLIIA